MGRIPIAGVWRTTAPQEALFTVVADLATWSEWWPAIQQVDLVAGTSEAPELARLRIDTPRPLRPLHIDVEVVEHDPPRLLVVRSSGGPLTGGGTLDVSANLDGSEVAYDLSLSVESLLLKPLEAVLAGATRSAGRKRLRRAGDDLARLAGGQPGDHEP